MNRLWEEFRCHLILWVTMWAEFFSHCDSHCEKIVRKLWVEMNTLIIFDIMGTYYGFINNSHLFLELSLFWLIERPWMSSSYIGRIILVTILKNNWLLWNIHSVKYSFREKLIDLNFSKNPWVIQKQETQVQLYGSLWPNLKTFTQTDAAFGLLMSAREVVI